MPPPPLLLLRLSKVLPTRCGVVYFFFSLPCRFPDHPAGEEKKCAFHVVLEAKWAKDAAVGDKLGFCLAARSAGTEGALGSASSSASFASLPT